MKAVPGGRDSQRAFLTSTSGKMLVAGAAVAAQSAADRIVQRCGTKKRPTFKVKVLDYGTPEAHDAVLSGYTVLPGMSASIKALPQWVQSAIGTQGYPFDRMSVNNMAYDALFREPNGRYVFHCDSQWRIYRSTERLTPGFVETAVSLMRADDHVYLASPITTQFMRPNPARGREFIPGAVLHSRPAERLEGLLQGFLWCFKENRTLWGERFLGRWPEGAAGLYNVRGPGRQTFVSTQSFLMDVDRFRGLLPLGPWQAQTEFMWRETMALKRPGAAYQVWVDETAGVFCGPSSAGAH